MYRTQQTIYLERNGNGLKSKSMVRTVRNITREANYLFGEVLVYGAKQQAFRTDEYPANEWDLVK